MRRSARSIAAVLVAVVLVLTVVAVAPSSAERGGRGRPGGGPPGGANGEDVARYVLPPGNYGGLPTTDESRDQLALYDGLTPLRGDVTDADIEQYFLPEDFEPIGQTQEIETGRPGLRLVYDEYGVAHVYGETREDVAFGAGWATARDRLLLLQLGRGPARAAVADVPGINAFSLVTSGQSFVPSPATEDLVTQQIDLLVETYGDEGRQIIADAQAGADGVNAYLQANGVAIEPFTVNDVVAVTAFIGSIFGAGGGGEAANAELLGELQAALGPGRGYAAWDDLMLFDDPEAPTTLERRFRYGPLTGGPVRGSVVLDPDSIVPLDPRQPATVAAPAEAPVSPPAAEPPAPSTAPSTTEPPTAPSTAPSTTESPTAPSTTEPPAPPSTTGPPAAGPSTAGPPAGAPTDDAMVDATAAPPRLEASNFLVVDPRRSDSGNTQAVMGPQLGYYYPEIVQQIHLSGPGIEAQGAAVPGLSMYILIGRTTDYAWSLTSAGHDVRDVYAEQLCEPDGSAPTRDSDHYVFEGQCRPFEVFEAGTLNGTPISYPTSVHGPVTGTATVDGQPYALARKRSTFGRDVLNLAALKDMTEGDASNPNRFFESANKFEFTFNWAYASRRNVAYFTSGRLPHRPPHLDRRLPTLGTGEYEWQGFLSGRQHPHDEHVPGGLLLNWNNQSAPGFMHGDDEPYGSAHRVEVFDQWPARPELADVVGIMNRAATEDVRSPVWPVVSQVLRSGPAPSALGAQALDVIDEWVRRDAPRLDADLDGRNDDAGAVILDAVWRPIAEAVVRPVVGDLLGDVNGVRNLGGQDGHSIVDKDLRTLLDPRSVRGPFELRYCGNGSLDACRDSLWAAFEQAIAGLAASQGADPAAWRGQASRTGFQPGLIPDTIRTTNRPTFQQVLELAYDRRGRGHDRDDRPGRGRGRGR